MGIVHVRGDDRRLRWETRLVCTSRHMKSLILVVET